MENQVETIKYSPEKAKQNALAKLGVAKRTLFYWKKQYDWGKKRM